MSDNSELFHLKEEWRRRAHIAEEKVEELEARHQRLIELVSRHEPVLLELFEAICKREQP